MSSDTYNSSKQFCIIFRIVNLRSELQRNLCQWDLIKTYFPKVIKQVKYEFATRLNDFYKYDVQVIKLFRYHFPMRINTVDDNVQMEIIEQQNNKVLNGSFHR